MSFALVCTSYVTAQEEEEGVGVASSIGEKMQVISPPGIIEQFTGKVFVTSSRREKPERIYIGMEVKEGDTIYTFPNSVVEIKFESGRVKIKENTTLTISQSLIDKTKEAYILRFALWLGGIVAKVEKSLGAEGKFEVHTPVVVCAVRGTEFSVDVDKDKVTKVKVISGKVSVEDFSKKEPQVVELEENREITIKPDKLPSQRITKLKEEEAAEEVAEKAEKREEKEVVSKSKPSLQHAPAQVQQPPPAPAKPSFSMNGNFGAVVLSDPDGEKKMYSQISLSPEFSIWKFGIGLDITLYFDENGQIRGTDWDEWSDAITKINYIRFAQKGEPFYLYVGRFFDLTIGHGFIMYNYTNNLLYPSERRVGVEWGMDLRYVGFNVMVNDINRAEIYGGRIYVRPLYGLNLPIVKNITFGATCVSDSNTDSNKDTLSDQMSVYGVDAELPLINSIVFTGTIFADYARMKVGEAFIPTEILPLEINGSGFASGICGKILGMIDYRIEYRNLENNFIPSYFTKFYDIERKNKPYTIPFSSKPVKEGYYGELKLSLLGDKVSCGVFYENYNLDPEGVYPYLHGELRIDPSVLNNKLSLVFYYDKRNVLTWKDLVTVRGRNTIITTEVGYPVTPNIYITVTTRQSFDQNGEPFTSTSIGTRVKF